MIDVILIEPKTQKNLGATARAMKNFEFTNLVLINPKCKVGKEAHNTAKHAQDVLNKAKIKTEKYLKTYDYLIGTTAILGRDYNIPRNPISPRVCAEKIATLPKKSKIALIIGRESSGLTNEELEMCHMLVNIPASKKYPTMNVSHALTIMLYEFYQAQDTVKTDSHIKFATKTELKIINRYLNKTLNTIEFETPEKKQTQKKVWMRVFGKATMTKRESLVVMGFFAKLLQKRAKR